MAHTHEHDHENEEDHFITLVDDDGSESLYEILLNIDGMEEFGKNYVLLMPVDSDEDEDGEVEIQAYSFTVDENGLEGELMPIPEDADDEWDLIEEVFDNFMEQQDEE